MKKDKPFKACLVSIALTASALLLWQLLGVKKAAGLISEAQETGGLVRAKPTQNARPTTPPSLAGTRWKVTVRDCEWEDCDCTIDFDFMVGEKFSITSQCLVGDDLKDGVKTESGLWRQSGNTFSASTSDPITETWVEAGKRKTREVTENGKTRIEGSIQGTRLKGQMVYENLVNSYTQTQKFVGVKKKRLFE